MSVVGVMNNGGPEICGGDRWFTVKDKLTEKEKNHFDNNNKKKRSSVAVMSSICSDDDDESSIGDNSDVTGGEIIEDSGETGEEVQSPFKGPLDGMDALEDVLPMRRGISRFYNGKSKSFASLGEASSSISSIKHITKPDNPYNKRRRNLLASALICDNHHHHHRSSPLSCVNGGGISKKKIACNSSNCANTLAFALSMNNNNNNNHDDISSGVNNVGFLRFSSSSSRGFKNLSGWRSFSFADLPQPGSEMDAAANPNPN